MHESRERGLEREDRCSGGWVGRTCDIEVMAKGSPFLDDLLGHT